MSAFGKRRLRITRASIVDEAKKKLAEAKKLNDEAQASDDVNVIMERYRQVMAINAEVDEMLDEAKKLPKK